MQAFVIGEEFKDGSIRAGDVLWITGEGNPAKGSFAFTKKWPDVSRNEPREFKGPAIATLARFITNGISVIKDDRAIVHQIHHGADMFRHRCLSAIGEFLRLLFGVLRCIVKIDALGDIAEWIMCGGLIRHDVNRYATAA